MRSDEGAAEKADCNDPVVKAACLLDSEACPAACKDSEEKTDEKVKAGDLAVTAESAPTTKVLKSGTSDLDTLTFKTSENVEINKITLERYGYSKEDQIVGVWLEDQDGNIIADSKTLSKDKVTLNLKKNYRAVDGVLEATVVVSTSGADGTIGFKVTDVDSTAKNLNVDNYKPYTYEVIGYDASEVTLELKGSDKEYNYEEGKSYEIARLRIAAGNSDMIVKGFTLTNNGKVDMKESLDKLTIKVDSKEVSAKYNVNKDDELVVTFSDDVEIKMNKKATFVLEASFKDFDDYGETVEYYIADTSADFNAVESKNNSRVKIQTNAATKNDVTVYKFNGGKIKLSNKKLGNVDAAQGSEWIVVAEWDITVTEPISKASFKITAQGSGAAYIKNMYFVIDGDEYDNWTITESAGVYTIPFKDVSIEKSGKIQFKIDIKDPTDGISGSPVINFDASFGGANLSWAKYDNVSKQYVKASDVAGSISFSKVTIQAAKASLENNLSKDVEFLLKETNRKVVFDGTYTAKKGWDIDLNKFFIQWNYENPANWNNSNKLTFYLFVDGEEVADTDAIYTGTTSSIFSGGKLNSKVNAESFSDIRVKAGESVKVKVEAEVEAYGSKVKIPNLRLYIMWTDMSGNEDVGEGDETLKTIDIKEKGSVTIPSTSTDKTALLKGQNVTVAEFTIKPSNNNEGITLDQLVISGTINNGTTTTWIAYNKLRVKVWGIELDDPTSATGYDASANIFTGDLVYESTEEIPSSWIKVQILYKDDDAWQVSIELHSVNGKKFTNVYSKYLVPSIIHFTKQDEQTSGSEYEVSIENDDDSNSIGKFTMFKSCTGANGEPANWDDTDGAAVAYSTTSLNDNDTFTIYRTDAVQTICAIYYEVSGDFTSPFKVKLTKKDYKDFFKASNGKELAIPRS